MENIYINRLGICYFGWLDNLVEWQVLLGNWLLVRFALGQIQIVGHVYLNSLEELG